MKTPPASRNPRPAVVLVGPYPPPRDGMSLQLARWERGLREEGHPVRVVDTRPAERGRPVRRWLGFMVRLLRALPRADWVSAHSGSDVFFFAFTTPAVLLGRLLGHRVLVTYKGGRAEPFLQRHPRAGWVLRRAHAVFTPSAYLQRVLSERAGVQPVVLPNVMILDVPQSLPARDSQRPVLMVARNFDPMYDVGTAIEAFALIRQRLPGATLELFGDGEQRQRLEQDVVARGLGGVTFHGSRPPADLARAYARASLLLNPSTVDNTPNSLVEAMAFGVPVVSTDIGGVPDLTRGGEAARLVPVRRPDLMAAAALELLEQPAQAAALAAAGAEVAADFCWPQVYDRFLEVASIRPAAGDDDPVAGLRNRRSDRPGS